MRDFVSVDDFLDQMRDQHPEFFEPQNNPHNLLDGNAEPDLEDPALVYALVNTCLYLILDQHKQGEDVADALNNLADYLNTIDFAYGRLAVLYIGRDLDLAPTSGSWQDLVDRVATAETSTKTAKPFEEHLEDLAKFYGPNMDESPTADEILNGISFPEPDELNFDQATVLADGCLEGIKDVVGRYPGKSFLITEKVDNFLRFLLIMDNVELTVYFLRQAIHIAGDDFQSSNSKAYQEFVSRFGHVLMGQ